MQLNLLWNHGLKEKLNFIKYLNSCELLINLKALLQMITFLSKYSKALSQLLQDIAKLNVKTNFICTLQSKNSSL